MPHGYRVWTDDDVAKLKVLAGSKSPDDISRELGRTLAATVCKAHLLGISMRRPANAGLPRNWYKQPQERSSRL